MVTSDHAATVHSSQPGHLPRCRHLAHRCNEIIQCNGLATVQSLNLPRNNLTNLCIGILNHGKDSKIGFSIFSSEPGKDQNRKTRCQ